MTTSPSLPGGDSISIELLPYMMNRLTARINQLWLKELRPHGLTIPRWQVLSVLMALDGLRMGELAEMAGAEQAVLSRVVDQMQRDGLVERRPARDDSRAVEVWISHEGKALHRCLLPAAQAQVKALVAGLPKSRSVALLEGMAKMLEAVS